MNLTESYTIDTTAHLAEVGGALVLEQATAPRSREDLLMESLLNFNASYIDRSDALRDENGRLWDAIGGSHEFDDEPYDTEQELFEIINDCRKLAKRNEYAINGHENRISYIIGEGHQYMVAPNTGDDVSDADLTAAQAVIDDFCEENKWAQRQQENIRREDRDGERFLRFFEDQEGIRVRYIEPEQVFRPESLRSNEAASFGIETDPDDVETVIRYYVDEEPVEADKIQHCKAGCDINDKRGLPLFYPVRRRLEAIVDLEFRTRAAVGIVAGHALIRRHRGTMAGTDALGNSLKAGTYTNPLTNKTVRLQNIDPGTIVDISNGIEYDFPGANIRWDGFLSVISFMLRGVASRLVMPEFMLTSDASNANYSSTLVAEGPAVKLFKRWQASQMTADREVMRRVLRHAERNGRLSSGLAERVMVQIEPPRVETRNRKEDIEADVILCDKKVMSKQTLSSRHGLEYDQEQEQIVAHDEAYPSDSPFGGNGGLFGASQSDNKPVDDEEDEPEPAADELDTANDGETS